MIYFTSDTHFNHVNILKYCSRPFSSLENMTEELVRRWNEKVSTSDTVYHLGDFAMGDKQQIPKLRASLNGNIILVKGNHDYDRKGKILQPIINGGFSDLHRELYVDVDDVKLFLKHEPDMNFAPSDLAQYHICGHIHQAWTRKTSNAGGIILNAGVDVHDYVPVTLQELINKPDIVGKSHHTEY